MLVLRFFGAGGLVAMEVRVFFVTHASGTAEATYTVRGSSMHMSKGGAIVKMPNSVKCDCLLQYGTVWSRCPSPQ
jgi:hypothetical protein